MIFRPVATPLDRLSICIALLQLEKYIHDREVRAHCLSFPVLVPTYMYISMYKYNKKITISRSQAEFFRRLCIIKRKQQQQQQQQQKKKLKILKY